VAFDIPVIAQVLSDLIVFIVNGVLIQSAYNNNNKP
jgi:hypothetical protein